MMKWLACSVALSAVLPMSEANAVELAYKWKKGQTVRFQVNSDDTMAMSAMGMAMNTAAVTDSRFTLAIDKVRADGTAEGTITIEAFKVVAKGGQVWASLDSVPKGALKNSVEIDRKGNFEFKEVVYLVVDEESGANLLVSGKGGAHGASATAQAGDEQVTLYAQFDPKTGQLSGGYTTKTVAEKKRQKRVAVKQDKPKVELLPTQFLELLQLPEGDVASGGKFMNKMGQLSIEVIAEELTADNAKLRTKVSSNVETKKVAAQAQAAAGGNDSDGDEDADTSGGLGMAGMGGIAGMGGLPGMGAMPGMGAPAQEGGDAQPMDMAMKINADFTVEFDVKKGMLKAVYGTVGSDTAAAGMMKLTTTSKLKLSVL